MRGDTTKGTNSREGKAILIQPLLAERVPSTTSCLVQRNSLICATTISSDTAGDHSWSRDEKLILLVTRGGDELWPTTRRSFKKPNHPMHRSRRNERVVSNTTDNEWVSIGIDGSKYFVLSLFDFDSVR